MRNITLFQIYKTKPCEDPFCKLKNESHLKSLRFEEYCECQSYHSKYDQRRTPFQDLLTFEIVYNSEKSDRSSKPGPLNKVEYFFHPDIFKTEMCETESCKLTFCCRNHTKEEAAEWVNFRKCLKTLQELGGNVNHDDFKKIMQLNFWNSAFSKPKMTEPLRSPITNGEIGKHDSLEILRNFVDAHEEQKTEKKTKMGDIFSDLLKPIKNTVTNPPMINTMNNTPQQMVPVMTIPQITQQIRNNGYIPESLPLNNNLLISPELDISIADTLDLDNGTHNTMLMVRNNSNLKKNPFQDIYTYRQTVDMKEDETHEFKIFQNPKTNELQEIINKYVCGFLNNKGGTIYLGIDDDGLVVGIHCDRRTLDEIRLEVDNTLKKFEPPIMPSAYKVHERRIYEENKKALMHDRGVIEIVVSMGSQEELYFASNQKAYVRRQASCPVLTPQEIKEEIKNRMKRHYMKKSLEDLKDPQINNIIESMDTKYLKEIKPKIKETYHLLKKVLKSRGEDN